MLNKTVTIYYHQYDNNRRVRESDFMLESCLSIDGVGYEPESLFSLSDGDETYYNCPVWRHREQRVFAIRSPLDMRFRINPVRKLLSSPNLSDDQMQDYVSLGALQDPNWCTEKRTTLQLAVPKFLFWTDTPNVWMEQQPHWETAVKNNFTEVAGWYNVSNWQRSINCAMNVIDPRKEVSIKRGDILYEVCFHPPQHDAKIKLVKKTPPKRVINDFIRKLNIKRFVPWKTVDYALGPSEKKCPMRFMWSPQDKG